MQQYTDPLTQKTVGYVTNPDGSFIGNPPAKYQTFQGNWDANTNTPALGTGVGANGDFYKVTIGGATSFDFVAGAQPNDVIYKSNGLWFIDRLSVSTSSGLIYGTDDGGTTLRPALTDAAGRLIIKQENEIEESIWVDATDTYFVRRIDYDETTDTYIIANTQADGTVYAPTLPIRPAEGTGNDIISAEYEVINAGAGYSLGEIIKRVLIINSISSTVVSDIYYNLNTSAVITPIFADLTLLKQDDREVVVSHFEAINAGTGYSIGDYIDRLTVYDVSTTAMSVVSNVYYNLNTSLAITPLAVDLILRGTTDIRGNLSKIKESNDYVKTFTFLDAGLSTERPDTIVHSSATLGISVTETFVWAGAAPAYYISTITLS